jgi:hypothetical protein
LVAAFVATAALLESALGVTHPVLGAREVADCGFFRLLLLKVASAGAWRNEVTPKKHQKNKEFLPVSREPFGNDQFNLPLR